MTETKDARRRRIAEAARQGHDVDAGRRRWRDEQAAKAARGGAGDGGKPEGGGRG